jgi:S1-C subfamily serine protease
MVRRNYLGVLYATAEEGPQGVKVLDVVQASPAARAGFQGVNAPGAQSNDLMKAAIVVLAMSPVGAFAIPLAIAHDIYTSRQSPGDLIVAVNDRPVHDAQEFSEEMRRYQPGDTVSFSVMRSGKPLQITVQLEEEPL